MLSADLVRPDADRVVPSQDLTACFAIRAAADPGSLPRILELFAKRGLVPSSVQARLADGANATLSVDLQVAGLARDQIEILAETLRQIWLVERVLTAELLPAEARR